MIEEHKCGESSGINSNDSLPWVLQAPLVQKHPEVRLHRALLSHQCPPFLRPSLDLLYRLFHHLALVFPRLLLHPCFPEIQQHPEIVYMALRTLISFSSICARISRMTRQAISSRKSRQPWFSLRAQLSLWARRSDRTRWSHLSRCSRLTTWPSAFQEVQWVLLLPADHRALEVLVLRCFPEYLFHLFLQASLKSLESLVLPWFQGVPLLLFPRLFLVFLSYPLVQVPLHLLVLLLFPRDQVDRQAQRSQLIPLALLNLASLRTRNTISSCNSISASLSLWPNRPIGPRRTHIPSRSRWTPDCVVMVTSRSATSTS
ncbi:hypothetical protein B566_EDAN016180, partial [Ephemera danica]